MTEATSPRAERTGFREKAIRRQTAIRRLVRGGTALGAEARPAFPASEPGGGATRGADHDDDRVFRHRAFPADWRIALLPSYTLTLILQQIAVVGILGIAQTLIILTAGIDFTIGVIMVHFRCVW